MDRKLAAAVARAKQAALKVLKHNAHGPYHGLPRTAGWGYPEPYTRDLMIAALGILAAGDPGLITVLRRVLTTAADNQTERGHIPSLIHDAEDRGASDTTPLFLLATGCFREATGENDFLHDAIQRAMRWMDYQSPSDRVMVAQMPTSDWRDEQWVMGFGLYVNAVVYSYLRLFERHDKADVLENLMDRLTITSQTPHRHVHEGLVVKHKPYYAFWSYKIASSERFDLLGNSLAVLSGLASPTRAKRLIAWIERECPALREQNLLTGNLPPNFFPYIQPGDPDWRQRYETYNLPGEYHNGGVWPFICGFYVAAIVAAQRYKLAEQRLADLTELIRPARQADVEFGFNEWLRAQDRQVSGQDWQTWSAAMYLYAAACVEHRRTPFFDTIRAQPKRRSDK